MNLDRILLAVRARHRGGADERAELDVGERNLDDSHDLHIGAQVQLHVLAAARLDREQVAIDTFDGAAYPRGRQRLLGDRTKNRSSHHCCGHQRTSKRRTDYRHGEVPPWAAPYPGMRTVP